MAKSPKPETPENNSAPTDMSDTKTTTPVEEAPKKVDVVAVVEQVMKAEKSSPPEPKTLNVSSIADAKEKISDIEVIGNGDTWQLLCKASSKSQGWMKSCKAMEIPGYGVVVQVSTQNKDNVAEALVTIAGVKIASDVNGGKKIVAA